MCSAVYLDDNQGDLTILKIQPGRMMSFLANTNPFIPDFNLKDECTSNWYGACFYFIGT